MKKVLNIIILFFFSISLTACNWRLHINEKIDTETLNYISTVVINSNLKIQTQTYRIVLGKQIDGPLSGSGSGVIIKKDSEFYYVLTNYHVVQLSDQYLHRYQIDDIHNNSSTATFVVGDPNYDLAILKFKSSEDMQVMPFAEQDPKVGDLVFSIGSPSGRHNIITAGKILAIDNIENIDYKVIIHEAWIKNGSSGSMLINKNYQIVGLNTWGFSSKKTDNDYVAGGATPVSKIKEFLEKHEFSL